MRGAIIFYHMLCVNDYKDRFEKTYSKIKTSGLIDLTAMIFVNCVGDEKENGVEFLKQYEKVIPSTGDCDTDESSTLIKLWEICQIYDSNVLYLHSKGVTKPENINIQSWVDLMEYFAIEDFEKCFKALTMYDTCGVNLSFQPMKHYSGNFWWANSKYIRTRDKFDVSKSSLIDDRRWYCEFWLLDSNNVNPISMHQADCDLYANIYKREKYDRNFKNNQ